ncbi:MAG TPA: NAD(P)/FAD-dependent oxidoreductase [Thermoplasmata archaeon]|nr:NAD(P)/FAD-dependent oxidoreductase [Thermoplasmata archaeon]
MDFDVLVIGGGPVGGTVAGAVAARGYRVALVEEHREIGEPVQCGGLVTPRVFDLVPGRETIVNEVHGAEIFVPSGRRMEIDAGRTEAVVVDRAKFDQAIVSHALRRGVKSFLGAKALAGGYSDGGVDVLVDQDGASRRLTAQILVGADGVQSGVAKWFKILRPKHILPGFEVEMTGVTGDPGLVKLFVGNEIAPGFFGWIIPSGEDSGRVGLCVREGNAFAYLERMIAWGPVKQFVKRAQPLMYIAGGIPLGFPRRTYADRVMIVGDAACQVKGTSGGGIYAGLRAAVHCADTAVEALEAGDFSARQMRRYHKAWSGTMGKELRKDLAIFESFARLKDREMEELFDIFSQPEMVRIIEEHGDIDFPSKVGWRLLREEPRLLKYTGKALRVMLPRLGS